LLFWDENRNFRTALANIEPPTPDYGVLGWWAARRTRGIVAIPKLFLDVQPGLLVPAQCLPMEHRVISSFTNSLKGLLLILVAVCVAGFAILLQQGQVALRSVEQAAVQMGDGKDIVADILPPPLYIIETHLVAYQLLDEPLAERASPTSL
jgi:hypothetical protein